jgi:GH24 family phage-related lysozyme (muramidase)
MEWYIENGYINALKNMMRKYQYWGGKILRWLTIRRNAEVNLF